MQTTRVLLSGLPGMLRDLLCEVIGGTADIAVVGEKNTMEQVERTEESAIRDRVRELRPDVLIFGDIRVELPAAIEALRDHAPELRLIGISPDGRTLRRITESGQHALPDISLEFLMREIRGANRGGQ